MSNGRIKSHFTITFRVDSVVEEYGGRLSDLVMWRITHQTSDPVMVNPCSLWISGWQNAAIFAVDVTGQMKTRLILKRCDVKNILSIGSNYVSKSLTILSTLDAVPGYQCMHWCYLVGMQVQAFLQHCTCAAMRESSLLSRFTRVKQKLSL
jgi:hypothetical protein